jgi:phage/plasmid-associated DNA primase
LNLALIALKQLHKDGGFRDISVERVKEEYDNRANSVKAFLKERCIVDLAAPEYFTLTTEAYHEYSDYCAERNERPLDMNIFGKKLAEEGIEKERSRYNGNREYYYFGFKLLSELRGKNLALS